MGAFIEEYAMFMIAGVAFVGLMILWTYFTVNFRTVQKNLVADLTGADISLTETFSWYDDGE